MLVERAGLIGRCVLIVLSALLIQVAVISDLPAFGAVGDLMLLLAIAAGSVGGPDRGATFGFAAGITYDLLLESPFGLNALTFVLAGYAAGWVASWMLQPRWWFHSVAAAGISVGAVVVGVFVARLLGLEFRFDQVLKMVLVVAVWNAALILPARRMLRWGFGDQDLDRHRIAIS